MSSSGNPSVEGGAFAPFASGAFALLWTATLISNIGTWMHEVGAGWLMTTLNPDPAVVTLVQAATTLPVFCFALLAGALADRLDKRRMLIGINLALMAVVALLALLVWQEAMTPLLLILFTLVIGTGAAFMAPAWQAVVPQLVPRASLRPAIAMNSMGINISRAIGPALAGVLIATLGLAAPFVLNAFSYVVIIAALLLWRPAPTAPKTTRTTLLAEMGIGLRHVRHNPAMGATLIRAAAFFVFASAYWALLPLIARGAEGGGAELYGTLMALIGTGAVAGALLLPRLKQHVTSDQTVQIGTFGTAIALLAMAISDAPIALMTAALLGGLSWIAVLTSFHVSAQTALPDWVRARGLAVFLMVFFGAMAAGSILWGQAAARGSVSLTLLIAATGLLLALFATRRFTVGQGETQDLTPASVWPDAPAIATGQSGDSPAMVTVEYRIAEADQQEFVAQLSQFSRQRLRDGATRWHLHQSVEDPEQWVETFHLPSWFEHLEQHKRLTSTDAAAQSDLKALDLRTEGPRVRHYIKPA